MNIIKTSRRGFLGTTVAAAAAASAPFGLQAQSPAGDDLKLGVATYSLRKLPRDKAIQAIKDLNTPYVSIKEFHLRYTSTPEELAAGRKQFEDAGLKILSGGNISLQKPAELRKMFEYAKGAGMPMMVCAPTHETLDQVEALVKEFDIKAAIHNHGPEDKHFPTPQSVLTAVKNRDPRMGLCMDIGHSVRAGADIIASIKEAGPRLLDLHIKDLKNTRESSSQVAVGDGILPIVAMFKLLKKRGYQGGVMLEYEINGDNPFPGMQKSFAYMRGVLAGLRG
jgi:sugar phosphate isomerase/epimerase